MPINRDGDGPPLRRDDVKAPPPRADDLRATPFTDDVFDDDYYGRRRGRGSSLGLIAAIVVGAVVAASIGWYVFGTREPFVVTDGAGGTKLVKADPTPYKVKPDDPGGMQVDNQDKLVYERLDKGSPAKRVENLLPEPEQPKAPPLKKTDASPENPTPQATATGSEDPLAKLVAKVEGVKDAQPMTPAAPTEKSPPAAAMPMTPAAPTAAPAPPPAEQKVAALPPEPVQLPPAPAESAPSAPPPQAKAQALAQATAPSAGQPLQLLPKQPESEAAVPAPEPASAAAPPASAQPRAEPAPTAVATATPAPAAAKPFVDPSLPPSAQPPGQGGVFLQLSSALSEEGAMSDWKRISGKNTDVLGSLTPTVSAADLGGDRGMRYRLRAGPLDKATADSLCATLRSRSVDCLVRP